MCVGVLKHVRKDTKGHLSRVKRRRKWSAEEKVKILTEALEPGVTLSSVADRHGISRSQLYPWMRLAREGGIPDVSMNGPQKPLFAPVRIETAPSLPAPEMATPAAHPQRHPCVVEVALANGRVVRAEEGIEPLRLARLVAALDGTRS